MWLNKEDKYKNKHRWETCKRDKQNFKDTRWKLQNPKETTTNYHQKEKFLGDQISPQLDKTTAKTQCDNKDTKGDWREMINESSCERD